MKRNAYLGPDLNLRRRRFEQMIIVLSPTLITTTMAQMERMIRFPKDRHRVGRKAGEKRKVTNLLATARVGRGPGQKKNPTPS